MANQDDESSTDDARPSWGGLLRASARALGLAASVMERGLSKVDERMTRWREDRDGLSAHAVACIQAEDAAGLRAALAKSRLSMDPGARLAGAASQSLMGNAACLGSIPCAEFLVEHGHSIDAVDHWGKSPLDHAFESGRSDFVKWAVEGGAAFKPFSRSDPSARWFSVAASCDVGCVELAVELSPDKDRARRLAAAELARSASRPEALAAIEALWKAPRWKAAFLSVKGSGAGLGILALAACVPELWSKPHDRLYLMESHGRSTPLAKRAKELREANFPDPCRDPPRERSEAEREAALRLLDRLWGGGARFSLGEGSKALKSAAGQMDLGKFRWLRAHGCQEEPGPIGESAAAEAASNGCADLLAESLAGRDLADEAVWRPLLDLAARADKLTTVRWLAHSGVPLDSPLEGERNLLEAAGGDNLRGEVFPWLLERIPVDALRLRRLAAMLEAVHPWKRGTFEPLLRQCQARLDREALDASALAAPASKPAVRI